LLFSINQPNLDETLLRQIEAEVETVTRAVCDSATDDNTTAYVTVFAKRGRRAMPHIIRILNEANVEIASVEVREPDLEAVFLHLTGRALRDA
jgi:ABC-type multidrug transport system ATPase subunit